MSTKPDSKKALHSLPSVSATDAKTFEERSIRRLKAEGYRITMPRIQVIRALADSVNALSAYGIHERILGSGGRIDVVSVYRILETLTKVGLVHHICHIGVVDGYLACRLGDEHLSQSEHLYCSETQTVQETVVPTEVMKALRKQLKDLDFEATSIKIEIIGISARAGK